MLRCSMRVLNMVSCKWRFWLKLCRNATEPKLQVHVNVRIMSTQSQVFTGNADLFGVDFFSAVSEFLSALIFCLFATLSAMAQLLYVRQGTARVSIPISVLELRPAIQLPPHLHECCCCLQLRAPTTLHKLEARRQQTEIIDTHTNLTISLAFMPR